jgi:exodeoxyribonuclease V beta subunit
MPWHRFPRGVDAGNFLHSQMEWLAHVRFDLGPEHRQERLAQRTEQAGYGERQADVLAWLNAICHHPLPGLGAALAQAEQVLPEMEFWLPAEHAATAELDRICQSHWLVGQERPALSDTQVHGLLMGIADLVIQHEGRYWVLDYKSNHLGPDDEAYTPEAIAHSLAQHRYDAQAAIYLLALHRLLRSRLPDYDPSTQLGGAIYYYLRGLGGSAQAACVLPASVDLLTELDDWLHTSEETEQAIEP